MKANTMREVLQSMHNFEKIHVEKLLIDCGYGGYFISKFHYKL